MFHIQYEPADGGAKMQELNTEGRNRVLAYLARFEYPILAVYEQATPITKTMRNELRTWPGTLSRAAREFAFTIR